MESNWFKYLYLSDSWVGAFDIPAWPVEPPSPSTNRRGAVLTQSTPPFSSAPATLKFLICFQAQPTTFPLGCTFVQVNCGDRDWEHEQRVGDSPHLRDQMRYTCSHCWKVWTDACTDPDTNLPTRWNGHLRPFTGYPHLPFDGWLLKIGPFLWLCPDFATPFQRKPAWPFCRNHKGIKQSLSCLLTLLFLWMCVGLLCQLLMIKLVLLLLPFMHNGMLSDFICCFMFLLYGSFYEILLN